MQCMHCIYFFGACVALRRRTLPGSAVRLGAALQPPRRLPSRLLGRLLAMSAEGKEQSG